MKSLAFLAFLLLALSSVARGSSIAPTDFFSEADEAALRARLMEQLERGPALLREEDYYAVAALSALSPSTSDGAILPQSQSTQLCSQAMRILNTQSSVKKATEIDPEAIHRALGVIAALRCEAPAPASLTDLGKKIVEGVLDSDEDATVIVKIHAALAALHQIQRTEGAKVGVSSALAESVAERIVNLMDADGHFRARADTDDEEEPTAASSGLAYHALALLKRVGGLSAKRNKDEPVDAAKEGAREHIKAAAESAGKLLAEADEEDDSTIEFEDEHSPLRATALFWIGVEALARAGEAVTVTESQVAKLAEYFLRHKRVSDAVDAYHLVRALKTVSKNAFKKSPLVVTLPSTSILASSKGDESYLKIRVSDVFGKFVGKATVFLTKVYPAANPKQIVVNNQQATPLDGGDGTLYSFNLLAAKPDQGLYTVELSASPLNKDASVFSTVGARRIKVVVNAELSDVAIQVVDSADEEDPELAYKLTFPDKLANPLKANPLQHLLVSFRVRSQGRSLPVQQAFVVLRHEDSGHEVTLPARLSGNKYKVHLNLREAGSAFKGRSGKYSVHLLVGDAFLHRSYFWHMADIILSVGKQKDESAGSTDDALKGLKPEIHHQFRQPEKRPPSVVSLAFAFAVVAIPALVLLVGLFMIGANFRNFPTSSTGFLSAVGFHACIIAVIVLYVLYWLKLTMIETLIYLGGLGVVTVLFGWQALRHRYYGRKAHAKKD